MWWLTKVPYHLASLELVCKPRPFQRLASLETIGLPRLLETTSFEKLPSKGFFLHSISILLIKMKTLRFLTLGDVKWPSTAEVTSFVFFSIIYLRLMTFHIVVYLVYFCKRLKFVFFHSKLVTSDDLIWPWDYFFFKNRRQERHFDTQFIIFHRSPKFDLFGNLWPQVTFHDLETPFISNLTSRASFWYTIYPLLIRFEFWPEMTSNL